MRRLALSTALLIALAAHAATWEILFERGGLRVYVDRATMQLTGDTRRAWFRVEHAAEVPGGDGWPPHRSALELRQYDCLKRRAGVEHRQVFAGPNLSGPHLRGVEFKDVEMERAPPGTVGDAVLRAVCRATD